MERMCHLVPSAGPFTHSDLWNPLESSLSDLRTRRFPFLKVKSKAKTEAVSMPLPAPFSLSRQARKFPHILFFSLSFAVKSQASASLFAPWRMFALSGAVASQ